MLHDENILGSILIQCSDKPSGPLQLFKEKIMKLRLNKDASDVKVDKFLLEHRFGNIYSDSVSEYLWAVKEEFKKKLAVSGSINHANIIALAQVYAQ
ncbi:hypothetical protein Ciccas_004444 [Cichlidogyrus casuarinus]|uniref:Uncharacterized protein n=1 Tax=Cichlidogyrus casuarinus TaxID=1844966 RepID=A0ABD2QBG2_9PLAT